MKTLRFGAILALVAATTFGCSGDDDDSMDNAAGASSDGNAAGADGGGGAPAVAPLEVIGEWQSMFGDMTFDETITADTWGFASIIEYDNDKNVVITQNPDGTDDFANTYSRIVYLEPEADSFYYCTTDFGKKTLKEAQDASTEADSSDPDNSGCGTFPWTKLTAK